jgi:hypothetical protein
MKCDLSWVCCCGAVVLWCCLREDFVRIVGKIESDNKMIICFRRISRMNKGKV